MIVARSLVVLLGLVAQFVSGQSTTAAAAPSAAPVAQVSIGNNSYTYESLVGHGFWAASSQDFEGDTCGGWGSAISADVSSWKQLSDGSYQGIFYTIPDRGWNTNGTVDYQARVHKFLVHFTPYYNTAPTTGVQIKWQYLTSILLYDYRGVPTTGLDADFTIAPNGSFPTLPAGQNQQGQIKLSMDNEGLIYNADGSFWISDEYGPYVYRFSPEGILTYVIVPPEAFLPMRNGTLSFSADSAPIFNPNELPIPANPTTGRANNQGFEGLTASPDGKYLYVLLQSALDQDGGTTTNARENTRFLQWDLSAQKWIGEWVVQLPFYNDNGTTKVAAQSEVHYLAPNRFLVLARDSSRGYGQKNSTSVYRHLDIFDISNATNIIGTQYDNGSFPVAPNGTLVSSVTPAKYYSFIDFNLNTQLSKFGLINGGPLNGKGLLNEKWESIALLPTFRKANEYFLFSVNDNDFVTQNGYLYFGTQSYADTSGLDYNLQSLAFLVDFD